MFSKWVSVADVFLDRLCLSPLLLAVSEGKKAATSSSSPPQRTNVGFVRKSKNWFLLPQKVEFAYLQEKNLWNENLKKLHVLFHDSIFLPVAVFPQYLPLVFFPNFRYHQHLCLLSYMHVCIVD